MTVAEVIQALRDADLQDDAETNIQEVRVNRAAFCKVTLLNSWDLDEELSQNEDED